MVNKRLINTGEAAAAFDPLQNFETVTYTGNGGTQKISGYIRKGAAFNGSSSAINLGSTNQFASNGITVSMWINPSSVTTNQTLLGNGNGGSFAEGDLFIGIRSDGYIGYEIGQSSSIYEARYATTTQLSANTWHHVLMTFDSSLGTTIGRIYVDNTLQSTTATYAAGGTFSGDVFIGTLDLQLGKRNISGNELWYNGKIDQVRIFNTAITDSAKIAQLAAETYASSTKSTTDIFGDGSGVALYELDEDASDTGSVFAAKFNGSSTIEAIDSTLSSNTIRSYSAWIRKTTGGEQYILSNNNGTNYGAHLLVSSSNVLQGWVYNNANSGYYFNLNSGGSITLDKWHHVALTWGSTASDCKIYLDGTPTQTASSVSGSVPTTNAPNNLRIGSYNSNVYFNGLIRDVRVYSSILSGANVSNLSSETNIPTSNLVSHYQLNENADDSQGSNDGTWSGTEAYEGKYGGTPTNVNYLGMAFQPDLVWIKNRDVAREHILCDSVRGVNKELTANTTEAEESRGVNSFDSNGFTLDGLTPNYNGSGEDFVAWCWKAGGAAVSVSNGTGTSNITQSANQDAGFSITKYTGSVTGANKTFPHGLSAAPEMVIIKDIDWGTPNWFIWHQGLSGGDYYLTFTTASETQNNVVFSAAPTSSVVNLGFDSGVGDRTDDYIAYCFHSVDGYQKVGSYTGTGAAGNSVTTGFRPRFVMVKKSSGTGNWVIKDSVRDSTNPNSSNLYPNLSNAENTVTTLDMDFDDNGFTLDGTSGDVNGSSATYIYLAIA